MRISEYKALMTVVSDDEIQEDENFKDVLKEYPVKTRNRIKKVEKALRDSCGYRFSELSKKAQLYAARDYREGSNYPISLSEAFDLSRDCENEIIYNKNGEVVECQF